MSTAITPINHSLTPAYGWESQVELVKRMVAKDATDDELKIFLHQCRKTGLDPLAKQIYFVKRQGKGTIQTAIDGYRLIADRTGKYAGNDDPEYDDPENQPKWAKVTVYKMVEGTRCAFTATARWSQYYPGDTQGWAWKKMPHLMLGKCAEALALRKAFPAELSGVYTAEEMAQAGETHEEKQDAIYESRPIQVVVESVKSAENKKSKQQEVWVKAKEAYLVNENSTLTPLEGGFKGLAIEEVAMSKLLDTEGKLLELLCSVMETASTQTIYQIHKVFPVEAN